MKALTVNMHPGAGYLSPLVYYDVVNWSWNENNITIHLEDDEAKIVLNSDYVIGVVWKDEPEPEKAELYDIGGDEPIFNE